MQRWMTRKGYHEQYKGVGELMIGCLDAALTKEFASLKSLGHGAPEFYASCSAVVNLILPGRTAARVFAEKGEWARVATEVRDLVASSSIGASLFRSYEPLVANSEFKEARSHITLVDPFHMI